MSYGKENFKQMFDIEYGIPVYRVLHTYHRYFDIQKRIYLLLSLSAKRMERDFGNLLNDAIFRKHKKLSFVTVHSHENIF